MDNSNHYIGKTEAIVISESYIKNCMKFPDDVKFIRENQNVIEEQNKIFKVTGRLKAKNMYGQAVPYIYNVRVQYNGGEWSEYKYGKPANWTFLGGNLYNQSTGDFVEFNGEIEDSQ